MGGGWKEKGRGGCIDIGLSVRALAAMLGRRGYGLVLLSMALALGGDLSTYLDLEIRIGGTLRRGLADLHLLEGAEHLHLVWGTG